MIKVLKKNDDIVVELKGKGGDIITEFIALVMDLVDDGAVPISYLDGAFKFAVIKSKKGIEAASNAVKDMADFYKDLVGMEETVDED